MPQIPSPLTIEQWVARLYAWAVERWGQARAEAIRADLESTAQALVQVAEYPLEMVEHEPGFFFEGV
ncbi:MAG: hypothetical protein HYZ81_17735 [Nitrospinae bacterium]|nr:hypothetical protein [Nitrospinota bacterium]